MDILTEAQKEEQLFFTDPIDCTDDDSWKSYVKQNPVMWAYGHLRPKGVRRMPLSLLKRECDWTNKRHARRPVIAVVGPPQSGKSSIVKALGETGDGLMPKKTSDALRTEGTGSLLNTPSKLLELADQLATRKSNVVELTVFDIFGPYARRLLAKGVQLSDDFKLRGLWHITMATRSANHYFVFCTRTPKFYRAQPFGTDLTILFEEHYRVHECITVVPPGQKPEVTIAEIAKQEHDWKIGTVLGRPEMPPPPPLAPWTEYRGLPFYWRMN